MLTGDELRAWLLSTGIAGWVATPRGNSVDHFHRLAAGDPKYLLGLDLGDRWPYERVVEVMAAACGRPAEGWAEDGPDWIGPDRTIAGLDRAAEVLSAAAGRRVLVATGHPHGLLGLHLAIARALAAAGATLVTVPTGLGYEDHRIDQVDGVAMMHSGGSLRHSHYGGWMDLVLDAVERPDLVVADHGWTGAAAQRGIPAIGFADCNDPALFAGEAEGTVAVTVPLDDGLPYAVYEPVIAYLVGRAFG